jgi:hypothetical protein
MKDYRIIQDIEVQDINDLPVELEQGDTITDLQVDSNGSGLIFFFKFRKMQCWEYVYNIHDKIEEA